MIGFVQLPKPHEIRFTLTLETNIFLYFVVLRSILNQSVAYSRNKIPGRDLIPVTEKLKNIVFRVFLVTKIEKRRVSSIVKIV